MSEKILRCVWSVDCDPADVYGSDVVSVPNESALSTLKLFAFSVSFGDMPAFWAGSTCVSRVNVDNGYSYDFGFVLDETLQLVEAPRMDCSSLAATSNRYPPAYAFEVFKGYSSEGVLSLLNNPFANVVVDCRCKSMFFSAAFPKQTLSRLGSFRLKFTSNFGVSASYSVEFFAYPSFAVTVSSYISNSNINAEKGFWRERLCFWDVDCGSKIEYAVSENKICLPTDFIYSGFLVGTYQHWDFLSAIQRENAYGFKPFPAKYSWVIDHSSVQVKGCFGCFANFVGVCDFADGSDSHLRGEFEVFADFTVNKVMELPVVESLSLKSGFRDAITGVVESFHSLFKGVELYFVRRKLNQDCLLHTYMDSKIPYLTVTPIPPLNKLRGFLGGSL